MQVSRMQHKNKLLDMFWLVLLALVLAPATFGQSIAITQPASGTPTITAGTTSYSFTVALTSLPSVYRVCFQVDSYAASNPGEGTYPGSAPANALGCTLTAPWSYTWNPFWTLNGTHLVQATAYDVFGTVLATSSAVPFITANAWPVTCTPVWTVTPATAVTSPWSGQVNITATVSGGCAGDTLSILPFVDGVTQSAGAGVPLVANTVTRSIDTTAFTDEVHAVCLILDDSTHGTTYAATYHVNAAGEWCRNVTFANGANPMETRENASKIYLSVGGTFQLSPSVVNNDGTAGSPSGYVYLASQTGLVSQIGTPVVASVNSTGLVTAVGNGWAQILTMAKTCSASDLQVIGPSGFTVSSATCKWNWAAVGQIVHITTNTGGWTAGDYVVTKIPAAGQAQFATSPAVFGTTGGAFSTGPTSITDVFVNPTNVTSYFGTDGAVHTTYNAAVAQAVHSMFASIGLISGGRGDQPYNAYGGVLAQFAASGINTFELGMIATPVKSTSPNSGNYSAYQSTLNSYINSAVSYLGSYPNLRLYLIGTGLINDGTANASNIAEALYGSSSGVPSTLTPPVVQYAFQQWGLKTTSSGAHVAVGVNLEDEGNQNLGNYPLQGPITFSNTGTTQSWLESITATGGGGAGESCLATTNGSYAFMFNNRFVIHGSSITNLNSTAGNVFVATASGNNFTFPCANVPNGTYNAANDSGLVLEPNAYSWVNSNTAYPLSSAFASIRAQQLAASPTVPISMAPLGLSGCNAFANWGGNGIQSQGGITQFGDYTDFYSENGALTYISSRWSAHNILTTGNMGYELRLKYGCYNPSLPIMPLTQGTLNYVGLPGTPVSVCSAFGNTITFCAPHGIKNILPGITRLVITGGTDTGTPANSINNNFFIDSCPTLITCTVLLGATDFTSTATGGAITWQDGSTEVLTFENATGNVLNCGGGGYLCGDYFNYATTSNPHQERKRGQTFTFSVAPTGAATPTGACLNSQPCNWTRMFELLKENLNVTSTGSNMLNSQPGVALWHREVPILSATGGTALIAIDNNYHRGITPTTINPIASEGGSGDANADWVFGQQMEAIILGALADRKYQDQPYLSGYWDQVGFTGSVTYTFATNFALGTANTSNHLGQVVMHQYFEGAQAVPMFHAHNIADLMWNANLKYLAQPKLNAPDLGQWIDCGARAGSFGDILICLNTTDGPQTRTYTLTPYLQSGQNIIRYVLNSHGITMSTIASGTATDTLTLQPVESVWYVFPVSFATELVQPKPSVCWAPTTCAAGTSDIAGATGVAIRSAYDPYYLDLMAATDCASTFPCTLPVNPKIGPVYYKIVYYDSSNKVLATSDVQTF